MPHRRRCGTPNKSEEHTPALQSHAHLAYAVCSVKHCEVKIRYRSPAVPAQVRQYPDHCQLIFERSQRAVTPGQAAVFYDGDTLIGGAWIESAEPLDLK